MCFSHHRLPNNFRNFVFQFYILIIILQWNSLDSLILFFGLTIASMITASVVTIVGQISYIGLIIPNIVAMFKGDKIKGTLADTAVLGALFVLVCDVIARSVIMPFELPIELIVGIIGNILSHTILSLLLLSFPKMQFLA